MIGDTKEPNRAEKAKEVVVVTHIAPGYCRIRELEFSEKQVKTTWTDKSFALIGHQ